MSALVLPARLLADARMFFEDRGARGHEGTAMIKSGPRGPALVVPQQRPWRSVGGGVSVEVTRAGQLELAVALEPDELYASLLEHIEDLWASAFSDNMAFAPYVKDPDRMLMAKHTGWYLDMEVHAPDRVCEISQTR